VQKLQVDLPVAETVHHSVSAIITAIKMILGQSQVNWLVSNIWIDDSSNDNNDDDYDDDNANDDSSDNNDNDDDTPAGNTGVTSNASGESEASTLLAADNFSDANMTDTDAVETPMTQALVLQEQQTFQTTTSCCAKNNGKMGYLCCRDVQEGLG